MGRGAATVESRDAARATGDLCMSASRHVHDPYCIETKPEMQVPTLTEKQKNGTVTSQKSCVTTSTVQGRPCAFETLTDSCGLLTPAAPLLSRWWRSPRRPRLMCGGHQRQTASALPRLLSARMAEARPPLPLEAVVDELVLFHVVLRALAAEACTAGPGGRARGARRRTSAPAAAAAEEPLAAKECAKSADDGGDEDEEQHQPSSLL